jgi:hypothetical protein
LDFESRFFHPNRQISHGQLLARRRLASARSDGAEIGIAAPGSDDFTGESEGVTEIERKAGG